VLLLLFLVGQALSIAHHALVEHEECGGADGVLVCAHEVVTDRGEHRTDCGQEATEEDSEGPALDALDPDSGRQLLLPCGFPTPGEQRSIPAFPVVMVRCALTWEEPGPETPAEVHETSIPRFRLAPKQSPPGLA